jgi:hypothetical protein
LDSWTVRGLPGYWAILVPRATAKHPAGCGDASPMTVPSLAAFRVPELLGCPG